jgi:selenocysteine lyase/cysteine desulfurase
VFEHNSNLLPWRESGAKIEMIPLTDDGDFDYAYLQSKLKEYRG